MKLHVPFKPLATSTLTFILLLSALFCHADDSNKRKQVDDLLTAMNADSVLDGMYQQMINMAKSSTPHNNIKPEDKPYYDKHLERTIKLIQSEMSWDKLKTPLIEIYMTNFSDQEIQDLLAFYKSTTGQSLVKKQPQLMQQFMPHVQTTMSNIAPKMEALSKELRQELEEKRRKEKEDPLKKQN